MSSITIALRTNDAAMWRSPSVSTRFDATTVEKGVEFDNNEPHEFERAKDRMSELRCD